MPDGRGEGDLENGGGAPASSGASRGAEPTIPSLDTKIVDFKAMVLIPLITLLPFLGVGFWEEFGDGPFERLFYQWLGTSIMTARVLTATIVPTIMSVFPLAAWRLFPTSEQENHPESANRGRVLSGLPLFLTLMLFLYGDAFAQEFSDAIANWIAGQGYQPDQLVDTSERAISAAVSSVLAWGGFFLAYICGPPIGEVTKKGYEAAREGLASKVAAARERWQAMRGQDGRPEHAPLDPSGGGSYGTAGPVGSTN